jgi:hypothetical protein
MPGPTTEVLNEDLKAVRDDIHKLEVSIRDDFHKLEVSVRDDFHKLEVSFRNDFSNLQLSSRDELAKFKDELSQDITRVNLSVEKLASEFGLIKWFLGLLLATAVGGVVSGVWLVSNLSARVSVLEKPNK